MPYIQSSLRESLNVKLRPLLEVNLTAGDLAYALTRIVQSYIRKAGTKMTYAALAMAIGVMFLTILEIVRRVVEPYEQLKIRENGDVFDEFSG